jgi:hypothetical protein
MPCLVSSIERRVKGTDICRATDHHRPLLENLWSLGVKQFSFTHITDEFKLQPGASINLLYLVIIATMTEVLW